jgi:hypothetical protein
MSSAVIARPKITLDDVKPLVLRRLEVPLSIRLDRLDLPPVSWTPDYAAWRSASSGVIYPRAE